MAAQGSAMGQFATEGGNSMWRSKWSSVINAGLRALVNLMPGAYEGNQVLNVLAADPWTKDDLNTTCSYTAATLRKMEGEGHIK